jgi:hypothetical protein
MDEKHSLTYLLTAVSDVVHEILEYRKIIIYALLAKGLMGNCLHRHDSSPKFTYWILITSDIGYLVYTKFVGRNLYLFFTDLM